MVTGGSGFLGRHIVNGPATGSWQVVAPSSQAVDLRDRQSVDEMVRAWKPTAIVHTAYRNDDRASIVVATGNVAEAAQRYGSRLVHVSTDALFRGRLAPYREVDDPTPITDYGRWKAEAERVVAATTTDAVTVRTSLLYASNEMSVHELAVRDVVSGRSTMSFFTDEIRCPVLVEDLATRLVELAGRPELVGRLHLAGPVAHSRAALARHTAHKYGWDVSKLGFTTIEESGLIRPSRVALDSSLAASHGLAVRGPYDDVTES